MGNHQICDSGKFAIMDDLLPQMKDSDDRVLIFTQFTMVLDIMEQYLRIRGHKYLRLDGSTPVPERYASGHLTVVVSSLLLEVCLKITVKVLDG